MMNQPLIVKLEVEYMKQSILHAFHQHEVELGGLLESELNKAIKDFDFAAEVRSQVYRLMPELVKDSVRGAIWNVLNDSDVRSELQAIAQSAVAEFISARNSVRNE